jgi:hypothetical protein
MSKRLIDYNRIKADVLHRMAARIVVNYPPADPAFACSASLPLHAGGKIGEGYPDSLECSAETPERAVYGVVEMLAEWYEDPRSPSLVRSEEREVRTAPGHMARTEEQQMAFICRTVFH